MGLFLVVHIALSVVPTVTASRENLTYPILYKYDIIYYILFIIFYILYVFYIFYILYFVYYMVYIFNHIQYKLYFIFKILYVIYYVPWPSKPLKFVGFATKTEVRPAKPGFAVKTRVFLKTRVFTPYPFPCTN